MCTFYIWACAHIHGDQRTTLNADPQELPTLFGDKVTHRDSVSTSLALKLYTFAKATPGFLCEFSGSNSNLLAWMTSILLADCPVSLVPCTIAIHFKRLAQLQKREVLWNSCLFLLETPSQSEAQDTVLAVWKCATGKGHLHKEVNSPLLYWIDNRKAAQGEAQWLTQTMSQGELISASRGVLMMQAGVISGNLSTWAAWYTHRPLSYICSLRQSPEWQEKPSFIGYVPFPLSFQC